MLAALTAPAYGADASDMQTALAENDVMAGGASVHYLDRGAGRTNVLIHGAGCDAGE